MGLVMGSRAAIGAVLVLVMLAAAGSAPALARTTDEASGPQQPVDLNAASAEELTAVPGIGPATAERIVAWREEHGPFRRVEDLMKVKGIGEKSFEKLRPHVTVARGK